MYLKVFFWCILLRPGQRIKSVFVCVFSGLAGFMGSARPAVLQVQLCKRWCRTCTYGLLEAPGKVWRPWTSRIAKSHQEAQNGPSLLPTDVRSVCVFFFTKRKHFYYIYIYVLISVSISLFLLFVFILY